MSWNLVIELYNGTRLYLAHIDGENVNLCTNKDIASEFESSTKAYETQHFLKDNYGLEFEVIL